MTRIAALAAVLAVAVAAGVALAAPLADLADAIGTNIAEEVIVNPVDHKKA